MPKSKEKRTKEQMLQLLDQAIDQEELLLGKIQSLEAELAICRKKVENPRHELEEQALPKSKISFRLDFYRTEAKGPLKGIVEHLPTRETFSFAEGKLDGINGFIAQFVGKTDWNTSNALSGLTNKPDKALPKPDKKKQRLGSTAESEPESKHLLPRTETIKKTDDYPFLILTENNSKQSRTIRKAQPFAIEIPLDVTKDLHGKDCHLKISANSPGKSSGGLFELEENCIPTRKALRVPVPALALEPGVYQLWVSLGLRAEPHNPGYHKSRLLIVQ